MCYDWKLILELWMFGKMIRNSCLLLAKFKLGQSFIFILVCFGLLASCIGRLYRFLGTEFEVVWIGIEVLKF
jgi:hypothetical protein